MMKNLRYRQQKSLKYRQERFGGWVKKARKEEIDTGSGSRSPGDTLKLAQQLQEAKKRIKELKKTK